MKPRQRVMTLIAVAVAIVAVFVARQDRREKAESAGTPVPAPAALTMDQAAAPSSLGESAAPLPRLVELGSTTCVPCKKMKPILDQLRAEHGERLRVDFIDVKAHPEASREWKLRVIPTQVFLDADGQELWRHEGFIERAAILAKWAELGVDLGAGE